MFKNVAAVIALLSLVLTIVGCRSLIKGPETKCQMSQPRFNTNQYKNVAVVGSCKELNPILESMIVNYKYSPYNLIERVRLEYIAKEQGLPRATDLLDPQALARIGKIAGVDALIITECSPGDRDETRATMRFVDVTTGQVRTVSNRTYVNHFVPNTYSRPEGVATGFYQAIGPYQECWQE